MKTPYKTVLTIAGSDSGGCAGIQSYIKSISACGAYAASVITAITAQNTKGVFAIHPIPVAYIEKQLDAVLSDIDFDSVKIGMLHSCEVITAVKTALEAYEIKKMVLDPVMVATSGVPLIVDTAIDCLKSFLPHAHVITPNIPEAELLIGSTIGLDDMKDAAIAIGKKFQTSVLITGGHVKDARGEITDILYTYTKNKTVTMKHPFVNTTNIHGTGCSLSSGIATFLSFGDELELAVKKGCSYIHRAIDRGKDKVLGKGNGPVNHFGLK